MSDYLPEFQPPRTAAAQDESFEKHGNNSYQRFIFMAAFAARLERELADAIAAWNARAMLEPVAWQQRWTNPGDMAGVTPGETAWMPVDCKGRSLEHALNDLRAYRHNGRPCYEVRPLYAGAAPLLPGWISVKDRLPPEDEEVLLWWGETFPIDIGAWSGRTWQRANDGMTEYDAEPTHWMPAPPVPAGSPT